jgi:hypothetical protein
VVDPADIDDDEGWPEPACIFDNKFTKSDDEEDDAAPEPDDEPEFPAVLLEAEDDKAPFVTARGDSDAKLGVTTEEVVAPARLVPESD